MTRSVLGKIAKGSFLFLLPLLYLIFACPLLRLYRFFLRGRSHIDSDTPSVIYFSSVQWFEVWQRPQHCVSRLKETYPTFYVSPLPLHHILEDTLEWLKKRIYNHSPGLYVYSPILFSGENKWHLIRILNRALVVGYITELFLRFKIDKPIIWMNNPFHAYILKDFPHRLAVYDIMDEYTKFTIAPKDVTELESLLLERAKVVFTGTHSLYKEKRDCHCNITFVPCGVDYDHFKRAREKDRVEPAEDVAGIKHPVIGYFGGLNERIDPDLIEFIAERRRDWTILLVGPVHRSFKMAKEHDNIIFTGLKPYDTLPRYLVVFDVCILPYRMSDATYFINPVKLLEYMAAGKPIVSVPIPDIIEFYEEYIEIAGDYESFVAAVNRVLTSPHLEKINDALELAKTKSWDLMVDTMIERVRREVQYGNLTG